MLINKNIYKTLKIDGKREIKGAEVKAIVEEVINNTLEGNKEIISIYFNNNKNYLIDKIESDNPEFVEKVFDELEEKGIDIFGLGEIENVIIDIIEKKYENNLYLSLKNITEGKIVYENIGRDRNTTVQSMFSRALGVVKYTKDEINVNVDSTKKDFEKVSIRFKNYGKMDRENTKKFINLYEKGGGIFKIIKEEVMKSNEESRLIADIKSRIKLEFKETNIGENDAILDIIMINRESFKEKLKINPFVQIEKGDKESNNKLYNYLYNETEMRKDEIMKMFKNNDIYADKGGKMILNIRDEYGEITGAYQVDINNNREIKLLNNSKERSEEVENFINNKVLGIEKNQEQTEELEEDLEIE